MVRHPYSVISDFPELRLTLGASIKHTSIKEGSDVYFDCNIRANPWVHDVEWRFNEQPLHGNLSAGIIISNQSLVLQKVKKQHRGKYQCVALNSEGEGRSEEVRLDIQCKYYTIMSFNSHNSERFVFLEWALTCPVSKSGF